MSATYQARRRGYWRDGNRRWRQSLTATRRDEYLARRRNNYHARQPTHDNESDQRVTTPITLSSNANNQIHQLQNITGQPMTRLTDIRRLARSIGNQMELDSHNILQSVQPTLNVRRQRTHRNCARDYNEINGLLGYVLPAPKTCSHCGATIFHYETFDICCASGKIDLERTTPPDDLVNLFSQHTSEGRHFRKEIRSYNHVFSFTSMGVHVDENLSRGQGVYTFRAQGAVYHKIGSLLPTLATRPRYLQLYIYDTDHETDNRMCENTSLRRSIVEQIQNILHRDNPFIHTFRQFSQLPDLQSCRLIIKEQASNQRQYCMPCASQVAAIIVGGEEVGQLGERDIVVENVDGRLMNIKDTAGYYDPMQYPLLLPYGTYGWDIRTQSQNGENVTCRDFYAYMLQIRRNEQSLFLLATRLLQQYVVDNFVKIQTQRLRWIRGNQSVLRAELYEGLQDSFNAGETNPGNIGRRCILPSSFVGSPRDMYQRYHDAMSLVQNYGKPDLFVTMTCNPSWEEIKNELLPDQVAQDRPDLLTRIFRAKVEELKVDFFTKNVLGKVGAHVHVIEFQKRGLPHVHMLLIFDEDDKLANPEMFDGIVRAEIPSREEEPALYEKVLKHMIHGPCGRHNPRAPCMKDGICKKGFPKDFSNTTRQGNDSYPIYKRMRFDTVSLNRNVTVQVDNSWVVPYNPWLLLKYDCHINVEISVSVKNVKYLYKYVHKGSDRVSLEVRPEPNHDEVQQFVDARWVCAPEACWRIFKFQMSQIYPSVERLQLHLPDRQHVYYRCDRNLRDVLSDDRLSKTMLTEFFTLNQSDVSAQACLYREIPEKYRWDKSQKRWLRRRNNRKVIGRVYTASPSEGERFYLRVILNHVRGPKSFKDLLTVDGTLYSSFKQSAEARGFLENDDSVRQCLLEACAIKMPGALRRLFVTILVYCEPVGIRLLWNETYQSMIEDYPSSSNSNNTSLINRLLKDLNELLRQHQKRTSDYDLPALSIEEDVVSDVPKIIEDELAVHVPQEDLQSLQNLNSDQKMAFDTIYEAVENKSNSLFFVDGPGGTGKTYLYRALLAHFRANGHIALATATSGIAATILPGGRTAHSRFKIPISSNYSSLCSISKQSDLAYLLRRSVIIVWDEATMAHRHAFEALDRTLRDIINVDLPFGGKIMVFGGDFRQVLPVVPKGTKSEMIEASIVKSTFWNDVRVLSLHHNMRSRGDLPFSNFLLRVGNGDEVSLVDDMIKLPSCMVITWDGIRSLNQLIDSIFPNIATTIHDAQYMVQRAIITPLNNDVDEVNEMIIKLFPGEEHILYSYDSVEDDSRNLYQQEYLNSISPGLPPHKLIIKKGAPIMLLRNLDPKVGLCNGTRLLCRALYNNLIDAEILTGHFVGTRVFIPRIPLKTAENANLPFVMTRRQFPIKLSFCLTINKSQGQTIPHVGIYLPDNVFSHGQLYVALSRGISDITTKVLVKKGFIEGEVGVHTKNVVYKEVLLSANAA